MIAYSYVRWSSDKQTSGDSLARQTKIARDLCAKHGWNLDQSVRKDSGVSAFTGQNATKGALGDFLESVSSKKISTPCVLVVEAMDRISRQQITTSFDLIRSLLNSDVTICIANPYKLLTKDNLNNLWEIMGILVEIDQSHKFSETLSNRLRSSWKSKKEKARQGIVMTRKLPAWISLPVGSKSTKDFLIVQSKAAIVRLLFSKYQSGMGVPRIAIELTKSNIPCFGRAKAWNTTTIFRILKSKTVIGHYQPQEHSKANRSIRFNQGELVEDYYPQIISPDDFYAVQSQIDKRTIPRGPKKNRHSIFSGLLKCSLCGGNMAMNTGASSIKKAKPYRVILCSNAKRGTNCNGTTIPYVFFEEIMTQVLFMLLIQKTSNTSAITNIVESIEGQIMELDRKIENLLITAEDSKDGHSIIGKRIDVLSKARSILSNKLEIERNTPLEITNRQLLANWQPLEPTIENREKISHVLSSLIERINIDPSTQTADIKLRSTDPNIKNEIQWDRKKRTYIKVNGVTIQKGGNQLWLTDTRTISQSDLIPIPDGKEPSRELVRDTYRVIVQTRTKKLKYKCLDLGTHLEYWEITPSGKSTQTRGFTLRTEENNLTLHGQHPDEPHQ